MEAVRSPSLASTPAAEEAACIGLTNEVVPMSGAAGANQEARCDDHRKVVGPSQRTSDEVIRGIHSSIMPRIQSVCAQIIHTYYMQRNIDAFP